MSSIARGRLVFASKVLLISAAAVTLGAQRSHDVPTQFNEFTIAQLQEAMNDGRLTSERLTRFYIERIFALDQNGPGVNSVIELNPDAIELAERADAMRRRGATAVNFPLLGIPLLLKDNIDTGDNMQTTAGSFALAGLPAVQDSTVAAKLRAAGAVILGKTNLSEWANFRSTHSSSGWSGRGGLTHNPYSLDRNACGSSSGSGAAAAANFAAISFGSETDGSIVCPGSVNGVVGLKPTIGVASRAGVVPISHTQDTVGPHGRTVADAVIALNAIASRSPDPRDPATSGVPLGWQACSPVCNGTPLPGKNRPALPGDYSAFLNPTGLNGARLGLTRQGIQVAPPQVVSAFDAAIQAIKNAGGIIVDLDDPVNNFSFSPADGEFLVLEYDLKVDLTRYFHTRVGVPVAGGDLQSAIDFNNAHAAAEMPYFGQEIFLQAQSLTLSPNFCQPGFTSSVLPTTGTCMSYNDALKIDHMAGASLDAALADFKLDAIVAPTDSPGWTTDLILGDHFLFASSGLAGPPGYPIIQVPAGEVLGMPVGISFIGTAFSEPTLIKLASGFEAVTHARTEPTFARDITKTHTSGTTLVHPPDEESPQGKRRHRPHHM
ncbi:MAG TPA: amidase family protein [Vicinamibacterales bacterium]|nr:amidase family protein [Vicinamibacterales bacterium]